MLFKALFISGLSLFLIACSYSHTTQELNFGKTAFQAGNFKQAFNYLLPLAAEGNAEAEYAVGYLYYYGYGIARDADSGIFWMKKSAGQHFQPAIAAMQTISP